MKAEEKTREQLLMEVADLRQHLAHLYSAKNQEKKRQKHLVRSFKKFRHMLEGVLEVLESRDPHLGEHQRRVAHLSCAIAREMGLAPEQMEALSIAALMHDIGKVFIPLEILNKVEPLSEAEMALIKTHPQAGNFILQNHDFSWPVPQIVLQHHERLDGSGYPAGLRGEEILLEAKILAVPDVIEAMTYSRPYRPNHGINKALQEVYENRGVLYDPEVVDICLTLFDNGFDFL